MDNYVNPDAPVLGQHKFIKYQYQEPVVTQGYYYQGGGFDPFAPQYQPSYNQPQAVETRRFMGPDVSQMHQAQQSFFPQNQQPIGTTILNGFIEQHQMQPVQQVPAPQPTMQPLQISPWHQPINVGPMNNNNQFLQPFCEDSFLSRPYGNYSDMSQGMIVPPINRREMWDTSHTPPVTYDNPTINWNAPSQQNNYCYTTPQVPQQYCSPFQNPTQETPGSWYTRAQENWK